MTEGMGNGKRRWSRAKLADILRLKLEGHTLKEIGQRYGIGEAAISKRLGRLLIRLDREQDEAYQRERPAILRAAQRAMLMDIFDPEKRRKATTGNAAYAFTQLHQAERLEVGQSTANVALHALVEAVERDLERGAKRAEIPSGNDGGNAEPK